MSDFPEVPIRLSIASTPAHLPVVRAALECLCELIGFREQARGQIVLAADEALSNVIQHAYHGALDRPIEIALSRIGGEGGGLQIEVHHWGEPAEPGEIRPRNLDEVRPGGLGLHIMSNCMDRVEYVPAPAGGTCLRMVKMLQARSCG